MCKGRQALLALLLVLLLVACGPKAVPAPQTAPAAASAQPSVAAPAPAPKSAAPAKPAWEIEWEKTAAAARQEGKLVYYTSLGPEPRRILTDPFESKYGVRVESMTGASGTFAPKLFTEQRAGIYSGDTWTSGSTTHIPLKGALDNLDPVLILPELLEPELIKKTWYFGELPWGDKAHTMLIGLMSFNEVICTNTNIVKAGEIKAYRDLLDPKWKGKIGLLDPRVSSMGLMWFAVAQEVGDVDVNFMRDLATKQEIFVTRDRRLQIEWLAQGKHAITLGPETASFTNFMQMGAPVTRFSLGTPFVSGATSGIGMLKKPPHPNAAKLFINWLMSREGQEFHSKAVGAQAQRLDASTAHLEASKVLKPGLKLFRSDQEDFAVKKDSYYIDLAKQVFGAY